MLEGNVFLTGGSGFLGRAILTRAKDEHWPAKFTVYSRDETKQWELKHRFPEVRCLLGDVARDLPRLIAAIAGHDTVLHLAAVKYIPEAEANCFEAVEVNITGTSNVIFASLANQVKTVVGISTDKACAPLNLYGMTKAVGERLFSEANRMGNTDFVTVRYGNVIGSTGSVIPLFRRQIKDFNQIRITDQRMTRFWLSPDAAVKQVLWAHNNAHEYRGFTFIDACPAMSIADLARAVCQVSQVEKIEIVVTGMRPGEKLHESLFNDQEGPRVEALDNGFVMKPATFPAQAGSGLTGYMSDKPFRFLDIGEMAYLIQDAERI